LAIDDINIKLQQPLFIFDFSLSFLFNSTMPDSDSNSNSGDNDFLLMIDHELFDTIEG
jgi:hypothetical protein